MSQITLTPDEMPDFVVAFLMDNFKNEELRELNPLWKKFIETLEAKGVESQTMIYYLHMDAETRLKYKMIADVFSGKSSSAKINITKNIAKTTERKIKYGNIKNIIKKVFKIVKEERYRTSMPITEMKMDKIIKYVMDQEKTEEDE
jgi:hypothetical protein